MMFMCRICSKKYRCLKKLLRLLLGGVGWGLGTLFAGQGDKILAFLTPDHFIIANINLMYCSCLVTVLRRHGGNPHLVENLYSLQSIMVQMGRLIFVHSFPSISPAFNHRARKLPSKKSIAQHRTVGSVFHIGNCRCRLSEGSAAFVW